jgi:PhnB protein
MSSPGIYPSSIEGCSVVIKGKKTGLTLSLVVSDALAAMNFYKTVFGAAEGEVYSFHDRLNSNEAHVVVGGVALRLIDGNPDYSCFPPKKGDMDSIWLQIIVDNVDDTLNLARENGAEVLAEPSDFMGTRYAEIIDPFGYTWTINQILREVSYEERMAFYVESHKETDARKQRGEAVDVL